MNKRIISGILACCMSAVLLTGCGKKQESATEPTTQKSEITDNTEPTSTQKLIDGISFDGIEIESEQENPTEEPKYTTVKFNENQIEDLKNIMKNGGEWEINKSEHTHGEEGSVCLTYKDKWALRLHYDFCDAHEGEEKNEKDSVPHTLITVYDPTYDAANPDESKVRHYIASIRLFEDINDFFVKFFENK